MDVKESRYVGTQTELERPIFCYECDFHTLGEHMMESHAFTCRTCGDKFDDQEGVDEHEPNHNKETEKDLNIDQKEHDPIPKFLFTYVIKKLKLKDEIRTNGTCE